MKSIKLLVIFVLGLILVISAGCDRKVVVEGDNNEWGSADCFTCHGDEGYLLAAKGEWQNSIHASGNNVDYTNREGRDCAKCHDHQGFVEFVETGEINPPYTRVSAIHCFTCHAPHERGDLTLRTDEPYTLITGEVFDHGYANLCVNCHHSNSSVANISDDQPISNRFGPHHGPQGDLLIGVGGYEFDGETYESSPHASAVTDGCIGCHMGNPEVHNGYNIGGHSFNMVDEEGGYDLSEVCANAACHPSAEDFDYEGAQTAVDSLLDTLKVLLTAEGLLNGDGAPVTDTVDADIAGAVWNYVLVEEDRSRGIHNFKYISGLLETSIEYMEGVVAGKARVENQIAFVPRSSH